MPASFAWFLALRYLCTRWVNLLGMAGVALAVWALIVVIAVFSGFISEQTTSVRHASPDLLLTGLPHSSYTELQPLLAADPDVVSTAPRLVHYAMLNPQDQRIQLARQTESLSPPAIHQNYVALIGVDFQAEAQTSNMPQWLQTPDRFPGDHHPFGMDPSLAPEHWRVKDPNQPLQVSEEQRQEFRRQAGLAQPDLGTSLGKTPGILVGFNRMLLGNPLQPGQGMDLMSARFEDIQGEENLLPIKERIYVSGAFKTGYPFMDDHVVFVPLETLRRMLGHDEFDLDSLDIVSDVAIRLRAGAELKTVAARLQAQLQDFGGEVKTWQQQHQAFLDALNTERSLMKLVLFAVMLVAAFLVYATLHMMVTQKIKDIGILTSMGASPLGIAAIFLLCGAVIAITGCALGTLTGYLSAKALNPINDYVGEKFGRKLFPVEIYDLPEVPISLEPFWIGQVLLGAFLLTLLVAYLPARRAARMPPVQALRYE